MKLIEQIEKINPDVIVLKASHHLLYEKKEDLIETERVSISKKIPLLLDFSICHETKSLVFNELTDYPKVFNITSLLNASENIKKPRIAVGGAHLSIMEDKGKIVATGCISNTIDDILNVYLPFGKKADIYILGGVTISDRDVSGKIFYVDKAFRPKFDISHAYLS